MKNYFFLISFLLTFSVISIFSQQNPTAATNSELVLNVTVTDTEGQLVIGLDKNAFTVSEGKETAEIASFVTDEPAEIFFLLEKSNGMSNFYRKSDAGKQSFVYGVISRFMQLGNASNYYSLFAFNKVQEPLLAATNNQNDVLSAIEKLDSLKLDGPTTYIDAAYFGIEKLSQSNRKKRALIVFTRGGDQKSKYTSKQLLNALKENNVLLYIIAVTEEISIAEMFSNAQLAKQGIYPAKHLQMMSKFDEYIKLTKITGGKSFFPRSAMETVEIFSRIASELRHQYTLGIKLAGTPKANKNQIKVKVNPPRGSPKVFVRSREEF